jgi:hypothetical protein
MVTFAPCFTPPSTDDVATGNEYADGMLGLFERSAYDPEVATVASPVIDAAGSDVTAAGMVGLFVRSA